MVGPVGRKELVSGMARERSSAAAGRLVVAVGSRLEGEEGHSLVGVEGVCWRSWVREGREIGFLEERSSAEGGIVVGRHNLVEGGSRPADGHRRSSRYLTL